MNSQYLRNLATIISSLKIYSSVEIKLLSCFNRRIPENDQEIKVDISHSISYVLRDNFTPEIIISREQYRVHYKKFDKEFHRNPKFGPAIEEYQPIYTADFKCSGYIHCEKYCVHNIKHRLDGPAIIKYIRFSDNSTRILEVKYYVGGDKHRDDGPAVIINRKDSENVLHETRKFYIDGKICRPDGPFGELPSIIKYRDSIPIYEAYYEGGEIHRNNDKPAIIKYMMKNGNRILTKLEYQKFGRHHRKIKKGPAVISYSEENGIVVPNVKFYIDGFQERIKNRLDLQHIYGIDEEGNPYHYCK